MSWPSQALTFETGAAVAAELDDPAAVWDVPLEQAVATAMALRTAM
jgi:hypothetical protein